MMNRKHMGSSFDTSLAEDTTLHEITAVAIKRVIAWQIASEMKGQKITKTAMAGKMHSSRAALDRLLDESDTNLALTMLVGVAAALGKKIKIELVPA
jgi:hypothetical protein